jgi:cell division protein FtsL
LATPAPAHRVPPPARPTRAPQPRPGARRAPQARLRAARRARFTRIFVVFVVCLTALAAGRVSLSFAVVQKSLRTDDVVRQQKALAAENAQLSAQIAQASSSVRIRNVAEHQLGLVGATHVMYLRAKAPGQTRVADPGALALN